MMQNISAVPKDGPIPLPPQQQQPPMMMQQPQPNPGQPPMEMFGGAPNQGQPPPRPMQQRFMNQQQMPMPQGKIRITRDTLTLISKYTYFRKYDGPSTSYARS